MRKLFNWLVYGSAPKWDLKEEHQIVEAFKWDGVQYYQFKDINTLMSGRAFTALDFYNEFSMKCDREFLQAHTTAIENILNSKQINITDIAILNKQVKERLDMILIPDQVLKIASVVYFDKTESPYGYDHGYNHDKIKAWKGSEKVLDFFLQTPVRNLIPAINLSKSDLETYITIADKVNTEHLKKISTLLSEKDRSKEFYKILNLRKEQGTAKTS